ncbi:hypothetical protein NDK47_07920 [Brevibacillus ruminantium]|uniref:Lipoprotein n=1 Tax=Brevibacillus ruminantium TaxID=2950604 RepID=A0ABY4WP87_9BACL|nr:hypothetical protein [Brevibacillus ruminantium]USG67204.1 hypothetical protein NDK47_07920 [Brevibacillus ruminantium]
MRKAWSIVLFSLWCTALAGCNQMGVKQNPESAFEQVRDRFMEQQTFSFHGRTKLMAGQSANGNLVNFTGQKQGADIAMKVDFSVPEQNQAKSLSLLKKDQQLYVMTEGTQGWQSAAGRDAVFRQELNNWDPVFAMEQMNEMKKSVIPLNNRHANNDLTAVRVVLDSAKLKSWLAEQMKEQTSATAQSEGMGVMQQGEAIHQPRVKYALSLSEGTWNRSRKGAMIQQADPRVDELINQMELEAEYTIYYNRHTMLPANMTMSIRSVYTANDQRIREYSQVETVLQNYGQPMTLPQP